MPSRTKRFRGSRTHGRGKKAGRGHGFNGGRGNAGLHKHKFIHMIKYMPGHFGKHGFKRPQCVSASEITINIADLERNLPKLVQESKVKDVGGKVEVNLTELGYDKLLGSGLPSKAWRIIVASASEKAKEKISAKGGEIVNKTHGMGTALHGLGAPTTPPGPQQITPAKTPEQKK